MSGVAVAVSVAFCCLERNSDVYDPLQSDLRFWATPSPSNLEERTWTTSSPPPAPLEIRLWESSVLTHNLYFYPLASKHPKPQPQNALANNICIRIHEGFGVRIRSYISLSLFLFFFGYWFFGTTTWVSCRCPPFIFLVFLSDFRDLSESYFDIRKIEYKECIVSSFGGGGGQHNTLPMKSISISGQEVNHQINSRLFSTKCPTSLMEWLQELFPQKLF